MEQYVWEIECACIPQQNCCHGPLGNGKGDLDEYLHV